jgi:hypothetical protein
MTLSEFLDDFQVALDNGFGKTESVIKMHRALQSIEVAIIRARQLEVNDISFDSLELMIEDVINEP